MTLPWPGAARADSRDSVIAAAGHADREPLPGFLEEHIPEYSEWCLHDSIVHALYSSEESESASSFDGDSRPGEQKFHEEVDIIETALEMARARFSHLHRPANVSIDVRGGKNTYERFGVAADDVRAEANSGAAEAFCEKFRLCKSASFCLSYYVDDDVSGALAEGWAAKMQTLYNYWRDSGFDLGFEFKAMHAVWDEPARFTALAVGAAPQVMRRLSQIRMLKPR